jgi:thiol-disulfide isomerase/thioredoxin
MTKVKNILIFIAAITIAGGSGFALQKYLNQKQVQTNPMIGQQRVEFAAADLTGKFRNIKEWDGKIIFLNFWAPWCPPCKKEIPAFIELQKTYGEQGLQFIGAAIDNPESVMAYAKQVAVNYPLLMVENDGIGLGKRYGNGIGVLPYTVVINRDGGVTHTIRGELSKKRAKEILEELGIKL